MQVHPFLSLQRDFVILREFNCNTSVLFFGFFYLSLEKSLSVFNYFFLQISLFCENCVIDHANKFLVIFFVRRNSKKNCHIVGRRVKKSKHKKN